MSKLGVNSHRALESFLDGYLQTAVPVEEVPEPKVETCLSCNAEEVKITCSSTGCKRKRTKECATEMCFQCCFALKTPCQAHFRMRKKREEEDKYIEEGLRSTKKKTSFYHYEEKFMKSEQTIVIWCLQDFLARKEWSADTMAQYQREQRTLDLLRRRHSQNSQLHSTENTSSTAASSPRAAAASAKTTSTVSAASKDSKKTNKRSIEEVNSGNKDTSNQSPERKRGRPAKVSTPSSATSATFATSVTSAVKMDTSGAKNGTSKNASHKGTKLSKSARRFLKVQETWRRQLNL